MLLERKSGRLLTEVDTHNAMYDAEVAGRLYFAMRGIGYAAPN